MLALLGAAALLTCGTLSAGESGKLVIDDKAPIEEAEPWTICDIFDLSTLYESDQGFINEIALIGRYHGQWHNTEGDSSDAGWDHRRWRTGVEIVFLDNFTFQTDVNFNPDEGRFVEDFENLFVGWKKDGAYVTVGRQKPKITREYSTSSKRIKTLERSQLVNQLVPAKIGGVVGGYQISEPLWAEAGIYTGQLTEDWGLPESGDIAASARVGYQITEATEARFDYFFADGAGVDSGVKNHEHIFSWNTLTDWDRTHLVTDIIYGVGEGDVGDVFGIVVMPYYEITDKLEGVLRYTYSTGDGDDSIRLQKRYERPASTLGEYGDNYHAIYGGLNYYICGDKLKLMTGVEWATLDRPGGSFDSWTYLAGVRLYF